ncbi:hypothetical protein ACSLVQ_30010, partial [Klebsiella pneumoniae]|uniref:hypothetical protein n=1 Tax=Klebsiella pneumoniae TaxID=573 RepID=UPI003EE17F6F
TTIMVGRSPGVLSVDDANAALGTADSDTRTVNDLIVNVTAYNTKTQKSGNYTVLVPQGTTRDTEFLIGTSADVFDSITD